MSARRRLILGIPMLIILVALALVALPAMQRVGAQGNRHLLPIKTPYTAGAYLAYAQPWGAEDSPIFRRWGRISDSMWIDSATFPANTRINWAWPPFTPRNDAGVWGYHHIGYGAYDGGQPEKPVAPIQVKNLTAFRAAVGWNGDFRFGESTMLCEFYLRSDPRNNESKRIEIGWMLHMSGPTASFVATSRQLGTYVDPQGRRWRAAIWDKYMTFSPADGTDVKNGVLDIRHALGWLQAKGLVNGDYWVNGIAFGAEPIRGFGTADITRWQVELR